MRCYEDLALKTLPIIGSNGYVEWADDFNVMFVTIGYFATWIAKIKMVWKCNIGVYG